MDVLIGFVVGVRSGQYFVAVGGHGKGSVVFKSDFSGRRVKTDIFVTEIVFAIGFVRFQNGTGKRRARTKTNTHQKDKSNCKNR